MIEHRVEERDLKFGRLELREVLEVGKEAQRYLLAHVGDLQFAHDEMEVFDGPGSRRR